MRGRTFLVADSRERAVVPFLDDALPAHPYVVRQVTTGDFLVCWQPPAGPGGGAPPARVLACVERKTLDDFAASFKDARYENVRKMRELRAKTGCALYFFVEGPAFPAPERRFARIPFASISAAMTNLMVRDEVRIVLTADPGHSARRLADLLRAYDALAADGPAAAPPGGQRGGPPPFAALAGDGGDGDADAGGDGGDAGDGGGGGDADAGAGGGDAGAGGGDAGAGGGDAGAGGGDAGAGGGDAGAGGGDADGAGDDGWGGPPPPLTVPDVLTAATPRTEAEAVVLMWSRLRGVSVVQAKLLSREFSVADLLRGGVPPARLAALRTAAGRPLKPEVARLLAQLRAGDPALFTRLLSGIPRVTEEIAGFALEALGGARAVCEAPPAALAEVRIPQKGRTVRLGEARAGRVAALLRFREGGPGPAPATPAAPASVPPRAAPALAPPRAAPAVAPPRAAPALAPPRAAPALTPPRAAPALAPASAPPRAAPALAPALAPPRAAPPRPAPPRPPGG
jgi:hypothetical protein